MKTKDVVIERQESPAPQHLHLKTAIRAGAAFEDFDPDMPDGEDLDWFEEDDLDLM
jgi:hypothetical protein